MALYCDRDSTLICSLTKGPICMKEFFKNSEPFGMNMNFRKFCNHVYEFCRINDARSIQISSVVIRILKKQPIYQN